MEKQNWVVVGIGKLGKALLSRFEKRGVQMSMFHPDINKVNRCLQEYPIHRVVKKEELDRADFLILALPANQIIPFMQSLESSNISLQNPVFINMATAAHTSDLKQQYPRVKWAGVKFVGQADDLRENGNGLFVMEESNHSISQMYSQIGRVIIDREETVEKVNGIATYCAIKAVKEIKKELRQGGHQSEYEKQVLRSLVPGVVRSYAQGTLGHFAQSMQHN